MVGPENTSDSRPTTIRIQVMNSPKLSATTTPKLVALLFQSAAEAIPAPTSPMAPSGPIGIRSPGSRNASAIMAAIAVAATQHIGTMAMRDENMRSIQLGIRNWELGIGNSHRRSKSHFELLLAGS